MSTKRQPSKQRRQTQNQRQRAALETRRANAAAHEVPDGKVGGGSTAPSGGGGGGRSVLSRLRGASATGRSIRTGAPAGSMPVGHRAALSALLAAVAAAVVGALLIKVPLARDGEPVGSPSAIVAEWSLSALEAVQADPEATAEEVVDAVEDWSPGGEQAYGPAYFPMSLALLLPAVGAGLAFRAVAKRSPAKVVTRTMYVTLFGTLLTGQLLLVFLPAVVGVAIAAFQVRKAELAANAAAAADAASPGDYDVIEVEEAAESDDLLAAEDAADD